MSPAVASFIFAVGIAGLFFLDQGEKKRISKALWIPTVWLFLGMTRSVSEWLGMSTLPAGFGSNADYANFYLEGSPLDRAVFFVLEIIGLIVVINRWERVRPLLRRNRAIGLFFLYAALSISWSDFPLPAFKHLIKAIGDVMIVLIILGANLS